jgi:hypothetical protein
VADRLVEDAGVRPMLHRLFVAPVMDGDAIAGVIVESKAGREAILARRVIDATGALGRQDCLTAGHRQATLTT